MPILPLVIVAALAAIAWRSWRLQPGEGAEVSFDFQPFDAATMAPEPDTGPAEPRAPAIPAADLASYWRGLDATDGVNLMAWKPPAAAAQYAETIAKAENANGIPEGLLTRLLHQESRYRQDIITGRTRSPAGALGIAQFMPATAKELGIDPLDPNQAIPAAAAYLRRLYDSAGSWSGALAAYNWGIGNLRRKGIAKAPAETRAYVAQITNDTGVS